MSEYRLTPDAQDDLKEIARYTHLNHGAAQVERYRKALKRGFRALAQGTAWTTHPIPHRPEVHSQRCEHHYIFSVLEEGVPPTIVAVLHENMDLPSRLRDRLDREQGHG